jgi:hypothetical protein
MDFLLHRFRRLQAKGRIVGGGDGYLYGATEGVGGSIFKVAKNPELLPKNDPEFVLLRKFSCVQPVDGCESYAGLTKTADQKVRS